MKEKISLSLFDSKNQFLCAQLQEQDSAHKQQLFIAFASSDSMFFFFPLDVTWLLGLQCPALIRDLAGGFPARIMEIFASLLTNL